mgnify:CR=1 FL=1
MDSLDKRFWQAEVEELMQGYIFQEKSKEYICLICGKSFKKGIIYPDQNVLMEAELAVTNHINQKHGGIFNYLINMNKKYTGLTPTQKDILEYFYQGLSDKEIVEEQGGGSTSTIRNHRFKLNQKEKQARIFLTLMKLLERQDSQEMTDPQEFIEIHKGATMVDERYNITQKDKEHVMKNYFEDDGSLSIFPSKEKRKIIVLQHIIKEFEPNKEYSEKEVNQVIAKFYDDYVTIRRYMIEYGFMNRSRDCMSYWVKL